MPLVPDADLCTFVVTKGLPSWRVFGNEWGHIASCQRQKTVLRVHLSNCWRQKGHEAVAQILFPPKQPLSLSIGKRDTNWGCSCENTATFTPAYIGCCSLVLSAFVQLRSTCDCPCPHSINRSSPFAVVSATNSRDSPETVSVSRDAQRDAIPSELSLKSNH